LPMVCISLALVLLLYVCLVLSTADVTIEYEDAVSGYHIFVRLHTQLSVCRCVCTCLKGGTDWWFKGLHFNE